ncbi:MAG: hypothetical protein ACPLRA_02850, partial [Candidatus Saccharicenans sp.]
FRANNIPQGTSLTLDRKGPDQFAFWIKKSKKKTAILKLDFDSDKGRFTLSSQEAFTLAMPNKGIYLEREVVERVLQLYEECQGLDLRQLLVKIFKSPELTGNTRSLHFLRAYHLVDLLGPTTAEDVEYVLNNAPEFVSSEKKEGMFIYQEIQEPKEVPAEEMARPEASLLESLAEQLLTGEAEKAEAQAGAAGPPVEAPRPEEVRAQSPEVSAGPQVPEAEIQVKLEPLKEEKEKEKPPKKKKAKIEEKGPKPRKSERRAIEEKIIEEESEIEALEALKAQEEEQEEGAEAEEAIPVEIEVSKEEPKFGFFAEMLKSALSKKQPEQKEEEKK